MHGRRALREAGTSFFSPIQSKAKQARGTRRNLRERPGIVCFLKNPNRASPFLWSDVENVSCVRGSVFEG
jgi:hypothetical protein